MDPYENENVFTLCEGVILELMDMVRDHTHIELTTSNTNLLTPDIIKNCVEILKLPKNKKFFTKKLNGMLSTKKFTVEIIPGNERQVLDMSILDDIISPYQDLFNNMLIYHRSVCLNIKLKSCKEKAVNVYIMGDNRAKHVDIVFRDGYAHDVYLHSMFSTVEFTDPYTPVTFYISEIGEDPNFYYFRELTNRSGSHFPTIVASAQNLLDYPDEFGMISDIVDMTISPQQDSASVYSELYDQGIRHLRGITIPNLRSLNGFCTSLTNKITLTEKIEASVQLDELIDSLYHISFYYRDECCDSKRYYHDNSNAYLLAASQLPENEGTLFHYLGVCLYDIYNMIFSNYSPEDD